ncbi:hypothetical protein AB0O87_11450 [Microbacterium sp. NPDC076768]|uniref:hypothetical protein n=1 Tax=Microbacterium sp. NPDC076768 TaxID=3154858 RepID=UPI0034176910
MSTSDQPEQGPLTRKQLREIRLTGSTPVISTEDAAAAVKAAPPAPPLPEVAEPATPEPVTPETPPATPAPSAEHDANAAAETARLTRRQVREREKLETGETAVSDGTVSDANPSRDESAEAVPSSPRVSAVDPGDDDDIDDIDDAVVVAPVSATEVADVDEVLPAPKPSEAVVDHDDSVDDSDDVEAALGLVSDEQDASENDVAENDDLLAEADAGTAPDAEKDTDERPTVSSAFGEGVLADAAVTHTPFRPSFDELLTVADSTGSQHSSANALIFTPSPGEGSLSGPVASTGEVLVTGSYELPQGMGSQGHALGTTDGRDVDAVLIDGELPPASSPTPIAASSAVSTLKPAGEVIRPPAPEKGNRLMVILAIVAGGLALAVGVVVVIAITTNVF